VCAGDGDCAIGSFCDAATGCCAAGQAAGAACHPGRGGRECASGLCADGVCCDGACDGLCVACVRAKTGVADGTCAPVAAGSDPDQECAQEEAATCGTLRVCNGAGACRAHADGTICATQTCERARDPGEDQTCVYGCRAGRCDIDQPMPGRCDSDGFNLSPALRVAPAAEGQSFVRCGTLGPEGSWRVTLSPDGRRLAALTSAGTLRLVATDPWREVAQLASPVGAIDHVAFSPDGSRVATVSGELGQVAIWRAEDGRFERSFPGPPSSTLGGPALIQISPDGHLLATSLRTLIDLESGENLDWSTGQAITEPLAVNPPRRLTDSDFFGLQLLTRSRLLADVLGNAPGHSPRGRTLVLLDPRIPSWRKILAGGAYYIELRGYAASPDGQWVAAGQYNPASFGEPSGFFLYETATGTILAAQSQVGDSRVVAFSRDGTEIFSRLGDTLEVRRRSDLQVTRTVAWPAPGGAFLGRSPQGLLVFTTASATLWWDPDSAQVVRQLPWRLSYVTWSANGQLEAGGGDGALFHIWRAGDGAELCAPTRPASPSITLIATSPDGSAVALAAADGTVEVPAGGGLAPGLRVATSRGPAVRLAVSDDGSRVAVQGAAAGVSQPIDVIDVASGKRLLELPHAPVPDRGARIALSPDGSRLAHDDGQGTLAVVAVDGGAPLLTRPGAAFARWSPDGARIAGTMKTSDGGDELVGWQVEDGEEMTRTALPAGHRVIDAGWSRAIGIASAPNSTLERTLWVWGLADSVLQRSWPTPQPIGDEGPALAADGSFVGMRVYLIHTRANDWDASRVWDAGSGAQLRVFTPGRSLVAARDKLFSVEGTHVAVWCR
jgi:WD40 repeat protein